ncbi:MAG: AAA family ATPase, partial [Dehalococcoidia bacterium]|nr:AAA family ATPase [Dehalococcoidia bacterium]
MSKPVLHFESLHVRRMPGVTEGFPLKGLSKGINIIYGPNGIGKSTTALALQTILWPNIAANGADLAAEFSLDEEKWSVIVQSGNTKCRRGDQRAEHPIPGDPEERYRYHL